MISGYVFNRESAFRCVPTVTIFLGVHRTHMILKRMVLALYSDFLNISQFVLILFVTEVTPPKQFELRLRAAFFSKYIRRY